MASSSSRMSSANDDNNAAAVVPDTRDKLRYFQAKKRRWEASQQLRQRPLLVLAAVPAPTTAAALTASAESSRPSRGSSTSSTSTGSSDSSQQGVSSRFVSSSSSSSSSSTTEEEGGQPASGGGAGSESPSPPSKPTLVRPSIRDQVVLIYKKHNPDKLADVDALLEKYRGREQELLQKLTTKYEGNGGTKASGSSVASSSLASTYPLPPPIGSSTLQCFLKFSSHPSDRVVVELFTDVVPVTCENFRTLCLRPPSPMGYKQSIVHRIVPNFCVQMGDYTVGNGTGGKSIYSQNGVDMASQHKVKVDLWGNFADEAFLQHSEAGLLSMANNGPHKNGSQFFVTLKPLSHLDGKHVVFGRVVEGLESVIVDLARTTVTDDKQRPLVETIRITDCGQLVNGIEIRHEHELEPQPLAGTASTSAAAAPSFTGAVAGASAPSSALNTGLSTSFGLAGAAAATPAPTFGTAFGLGSTGTATSSSPFGTALGFGAAATTASAAATTSLTFGTSFGFGSSMGTGSSAQTANSTSPFGTAFGFGSKAAPNASASTFTNAPFSFASALSAAVANTSCDAFSSFQDAATRGDEMMGTCGADAVKHRYRSVDENESSSVVSTSAQEQHPVTTFNVRSHPPRSEKEDGEAGAAAAAATPAALRRTPSVPFSFSPSSTITTVDPFSFASSTISSTMEQDQVPSPAASQDVDTVDVDEDDDDEDYDPEDNDDDDDDYDSDETPSSCSEESVGDLDDEDADAANAVSVRMQASTNSTFSSTVPAPHANAAALPRFGLQSTIASPAPSSFATMAVSGLGTGTTTTSANGSDTVEPASPLSAVSVNQSPTKAPTVQCTSSPATTADDAHKPAKASPFGQRPGFGFGFGFGSSLGDGLSGFGSGSGMPLSFAGLVAASGNVAPGFGSGAKVSADSMHHEFSNEASGVPSQQTPPNQASEGLSFTAMRLISNQHTDAGRVNRNDDDDSDADGDHEETSSRSSSCRSESLSGECIRLADEEPTVAALLNIGCLAPTDHEHDGQPSSGNSLAIDKVQPASTDIDANPIATTAVVLSGVESNDDLTSPLDEASTKSDGVLELNDDPISPLDDASTKSDDVQESKPEMEATCEPPNAYSISFSSYGSMTFVDPLPSHNEEEEEVVPSNCNSPASRAHLQSLLDCSSETMDVPNSKLDETHESEMEDDPPEGGGADVEPSGASCGMCWCLKSETQETTNPSTTDEIGIESAPELDAKDAAAVEAQDAPKIEAENAVAAGAQDPVESPDEPAALQVGSSVADGTAPPTGSSKPVASPRASVPPDPTLSTDSEKEYVPESLRRSVAETSLALTEGLRGFLACVKEDRPLPDDVVTVPQDDEVVERPDSTEPAGDELKGDHPEEPVELSVPEVKIQVGTTSEPLVNSLSFLKPLQLPYEASDETESRRPDVTATSRFQVLGDNRLPKTKTSTSTPKPVRVRAPFLHPSSVPVPHDASLDWTSATIVLRYGTATARQEEIRPAEPEPVPIASTAGGTGGVEAPLALEGDPAALPPMDPPAQDDVAVAMEASDPPAPPLSSQPPPLSPPKPFFFGNAGPAPSAFFFGSSAAHTSNPPLTMADADADHPPVPSESGSWHTAPSPSSPTRLQSTSRSSGSPHPSPGLVNATCSSTSTTTNELAAATSSAPAAAVAPRLPPPDANTTTTNNNNVFQFGADFLPVVFRFEDRDAREATYARFGAVAANGAGGTEKGSSTGTAGTTVLGDEQESDVVAAPFSSC